MIEFRNLCGGSGSFSLDRINLKIESGSCSVIVGPTGAGKSFLIEALIGLRPLTAGQILVNDRDIADQPPQSRRIAYVPQDNCLFPNMTVKDNIWYGLRLKSLIDKETPELVEHLLDFLQIRHLLLRYPANLSGGEKQRVALARALATRPALLALDEPFSAIDNSLREDIRRLLKDLLEEFKTTTLIVTHDLDEAFFLGNCVSIMINGQIIQSGPREQMYYYPKSKAAAAFLGIKNSFAAQARIVDTDHVTVYWPDMNYELKVPCHCSQKRFVQGQQLNWGIRAEAVFIIRPGFENKPGFYIFSGKIKKFFQRGRTHTLIVEFSSNKDLKIEIDIHDAAARKLELSEGKEIKFSIEPGLIFLFSD